MLLLRAMWKFFAGMIGAACFFVPVVSAQIFTEPMALPEGIVATGDTTEVRALTAWAEEHRYRHPHQSREVAQRALTLAQSLDDLRGIGESYMILGKLVFSSDLHQAEMYYTEAQEAFEQIGDERSILHVWVSLGTVHGRRGNTRQALPLFFDALEGFERLKDTEGQARVLNNVGNTYKYQGDWEEAIVYYEQSLALLETINDFNFMIGILNNMGIVFLERDMYDEAETIFLQALEISEGQEIRFETAFTSNNLGVALNAQGHYERALPFLFRAERLSKELGEVIFLGVVYAALGKAFMGLGEYDQALRYATESLVLMEESRGDPRYLMMTHQALSQIYETTGNDRQAFAHYRYYTAIRDSIFNVEKAEVVAEMRTRYETEEKQRAIERLEQQSQLEALRASRRQNLLLFGIVVALLVACLFYYRYRTKQKASRLLEELDAAKSRFFANISHEFRTPLTVILGALQDGLAGRFGSLSEQLAGRDHVMLRNTRQLQRLINEVLDLNRLESGHLELRPVPGDLVLSLKHIVEASAPLAERNGITLTLVCDVDGCPRLYDEEKLEKIVGNLLSNALKLTPRDESVGVNLRCEDQVEISVTDDGPGIPVEAQVTVFDRFSQLDQGALKGGTGIGLALVKELTELHGGTITLQSIPGKGSTFTVRLPLERSTLAAVEEESARSLSGIEEFETGGDGYTNSPTFHEDKKSESEGDHTTVLIIEDNDDVRAYIRRSLEESYRVLEAIDGESGLQQAHNALPDLIVSDVMLPDFDGYEIVRRLKAMPDTECIPVVMLTARAAEHDHVTGYTSGAEGYITKPFSPETLKAAVTRLLEERKRLWRRLRQSTTFEEVTIFQDSLSTLLGRAQSVVLENLHDENFSIEELASALKITRRTLYSHIKSDTGLSPSDFIRILRLERAHRLLSEGAGSVTEVAYAVGFKSLSHFTRSFRERYGALPSHVLAVRD